MEFKILKTDFKNKYLVINSSDSIFFCNNQVKDILIYKEQKKTLDDICNIINSKYHKKYSVQHINEAIISLKSKKGLNISFKPILYLFKSNIVFPSNLYLVRFFYLIFLILFLSNLFFTHNVESYNLTLYENITKYIFLIIILIIHEIGHASFAKYYKITPGNIGVGRYLIFPVFFINLNEIWRLKKNKRIIINLGGVMFQLIIGILLVGLNCIFKNNVILSLIKVNFVIIILNINPFIKFDGYWVLSDIINNNNLYTESNKLIKSWLSFKYINTSKYTKAYSFARIIFWIYMLYLLTFSLINLWK